MLGTFLISYAVAVNKLRGRRVRPMKIVLNVVVLPLNHRVPVVNWFQAVIIISGCSTLVCNILLDMRFIRNR